MPNQSPVNFDDLPSYRGNEELYQSLNRQKLQQQVERVRLDKLKQTIDGLRQPTASVPTTPKTPLWKVKAPGPLGDIPSPNLKPLGDFLEKYGPPTKWGDAAKEAIVQAGKGFEAIRPNIYMGSKEAYLAKKAGNLPLTNKAMSKLGASLKPLGTIGKLGTETAPRLAPGTLTTTVAVAEPFNPVAVATAAILDLAMDPLFPAPTVKDDTIAAQLERQKENKELGSFWEVADQFLRDAMPASESNVIQEAVYPFTGGQTVGVNYTVETEASYRFTKTGYPTQTVTCKYRFLNVPGKVGGIYAQRSGDTFGGSGQAPVAYLYAGGSNPIFDAWDLVSPYYISNSIDWNVYNNNTCLSHAITSVTRSDGQPDTGGNPPPTTEPLYSSAGGNPRSSYLLSPDYGRFPPPLQNPIPTPIQRDTDTQVSPPSLPITPTATSAGPLLIPIVRPLPTSDPLGDPTERKVPGPLLPNDETIPITPKTVDNNSDPVAPAIPDKPRLKIPQGTDVIPEITTDYPKIAQPIPFPSQSDHPGPFMIPPPIAPPLAKTPTGGTPVKDGSKKGPEALPKQDPEPVTQTPQDNCRGGCTGKILDGIDKGNAGNKEIKDLINTQVPNAIDLTLLDTINNKLGNQISGGLSGFLTTAFRATRLDKVINLLTLLTALHNAAMLSRGMVDTLSSILDNVTVAFGIRDENDDPIDIASTIGKSIESALKDLLGNDVYSNLNEDWKKANRIYQATANLVNTSQSLFWSIKEVLEETGERVGKIGNALRRSSVVMEDSYNWMSEKLNITPGRLGLMQRVIDGSLNATEVVDDIDNITSELRNVQETASELSSQKNSFDALVKNGGADPNRENVPVKDSEVEKQTQSQGSNITKPDLIKPES